MLAHALRRQRLAQPLSIISVLIFWRLGHAPLAGGQRVVSGHDLAGNDAERPAVADNMVQVEEEQVLARSAKMEMRAEQRSVDQVEGQPALALELLEERRLVPGGGV